MNVDPPSGATVLVVEDERHLADLYAEYLADEYRVLTAYSGEEGLERLSADVDVLLLDRRMPVLSGNEVLAELEERDLDPRIVLITTEEPGFDAIDLGVDDYVVKPVTRDDVREVVDRLLVIERYTDRLRELSRKKLTRNVLLVERGRPELCEDERFRDLETDIDDLEATVERLAGQLDVEERNLRL